MSVVRVRPGRLVVAVSAATMLAVAAAPAAGAASPPTGPPPIPPVLSVTDLGTVGQNPVVSGRDGTQSAEFHGASIWTFGDTSMTVPGVEGKNWDDNSLSWTTDANAADGLSLDHDHLDSTGAPAEFLPYTKAELAYNDAHDPAHCTASPCGAEIAMWPAQVVADPARNRVLFFYSELWRLSGQPTWTTLGEGIAVWRPGGAVVRPVENPGSKTPTLMWSASEVGYTNASTVVGDTLYSYGCRAGFLVMNCSVARVPLADVLDKTRWSYYAGKGAWSSNPAAAVVVFQGGAAGSSVFYDRFLGDYVAIYSGVYSNTLYYRVASTPVGPWSGQAVLFTGQDGWNGNVDYAGIAHPEFAQGNGQTQYVTYVHATGFLRSDLPLVKVVFGTS